MSHRSEYKFVVAVQAVRYELQQTPRVPVGIRGLDGGKSNDRVAPELRGSILESARLTSLYDGNKERSIALQIL